MSACCASITEGGGQIETETLSNRSKLNRLRNNKLGPARVLGPEDRSNIEAEITNQVEIEPIEPHFSICVCVCVVLAHGAMLTFSVSFQV